METAFVLTSGFLSGCIVGLIAMQHLLVKPLRSRYIERLQVAEKGWAETIAILQDVVEDRESINFKEDEEGRIKSPITRIPDGS